VFRGHRAQIQCPGGAAAAILRQLQGVAVAQQPVQSSVHSGPDQCIRIQHDVRAAHQKRSVRVLLHGRLPASVPASATGRGRQTLCVPGPRAPSRSRRHAPKRIADVGKQPPGHRFSRANGTQLRVCGWHALRARRTVARSNNTTSLL